MFLRAVTWQRDSHGLFDYESKSITKKSLKTNTQGKIIRSSNEVDLVSINKNVKQLSEEAQTLLQIKYLKDRKFTHSNFLVGYILDHSKECDMMEEDSINRLWLVIRSLKSPQGKYDY